MQDDIILEKLNNIELEINNLCADMGDHAQKLEEYKLEVEDVKYQLADCLNAVTKVSCHFTEDLINDLDTSIDKLASKRSVKSMSQLVTVTCVISIFNMVSIIAILLYTFGMFR